jgi:tetratricopeptide (TPR) repeat protein
MKLVSTLSLGIALAAASISVAGITPAVAKEKPAAASSLKLSPAFRAAAAPLQDALVKKDGATAASKIAAAEAAATTPDEKYVAGTFRIQLGGLLNDPKMQSAGVEAALTSGSLPAADAPRFNFFSGQFAYQAGDYPKAAMRMAEAERLGYKDVNLFLLLGESDFKLKKFDEGLAAVERAINIETAAGRKAPEAWYGRAASVSYANKLLPQTAKWTRMQVKAYPSPENWRSTLLTYRDGNKLDGQLSIDLMRLMRVTGSLSGERDYVEYAIGASDRGLPGEAKTVIEEGLASGKVTRSSKTLNELLALSTAKAATDRPTLAASERQASGAASGKVAMATADAYLGYGDYAKATALYKLALQKGGVDADAANMRLGIATARGGDKPGSRSYFSVVKGPRADIANLWLAWLDTNPS